LTEVNSVTCGGTPGVSDTFATALWAPDAMLELIRAGASSADVHVRTEKVNAAFSFTSKGALVANPLLYGLVTYARTLGRHPKLLPARVTVPGRVDLKAWVVLDGNVLHVLLIDKSSRAAKTKLALPVTGKVTVQRLLAKAASATTGETLAGQTLGADGRWIGGLAQKRIAAVAGTYTVTVPGIRRIAAVARQSADSKQRRPNRLPLLFVHCGGTPRQRRVANGFAGTARERHDEESRRHAQTRPVPSHCTKPGC
jgi:hypothetical protein